MSHELRTPLVAVIGFAEMLHCQLLGPLGNTKYLEYAGDIQHSGEHLLRLINDILDITKAEAGEIEIRELAMNVHDVMTSVLGSMAPQAARAEVALQMAPVNALLCLRGDSGRVRQILLNLLSNAIKFTKPGGQIQLSASIAGNGDLHLAVNDSGIGIAAEDIPRALAPFGQIDSTLGRKYEGTGIGLPLAQKLLELHGGALQLESELGVGTEAIAVFPAERVNRRADATVPASAWSLAPANNL
jgi:signal transduction histidine kinase